MQKFKILVDSSCDLPDDYIKEHEIIVVPMPFTLDGREHSGGYWQEITAEDYYEKLSRGSIATTSQINVDIFTGIFTDYARRGEALLFLLLSSGLSGTYHCATLALEIVREQYPDCQIYPIDTLSATTGHGMLAMLAAQKGEEGASAGEAAAWLDEKKHNVFAFFTVDDLMYLHRGGRLSRLSAVAGELLGVKPMLNITTDGSLKLIDKVRGRKSALDKLAGRLSLGLTPGAQTDTVIISHTNSLNDALYVAKLIEESERASNIIVMQMGPVIGAHIGPGAVTLLYLGDVAR